MESSVQKSGVGAEDNNGKNDKISGLKNCQIKFLSKLSIPKPDVDSLMYNSCDDVRQALKAALEEQTKEMKLEQLMKIPETQGQEQNASTSKDISGVETRKRKRPGVMKIGNVKRSRRELIENMYRGKLSNVLRISNALYTPRSEKTKQV